VQRFLWDLAVNFRKDILRYLCPDLQHLKSGELLKLIRSVYVNLLFAIYKYNIYSCLKGGICIK